MSEIAKLKNDIACKQNIINHLAEHNIKLQQQLKAKEQECEGLKLQLTSLSYADAMCALEIDLEHKTQECKELKKQLTDFMNGEYCANGCKKNANSI